MTETCVDNIHPHRSDDDITAWVHSVRMTAPTIPAVFIGHGSPMNTLENNVFTEAWRSLAERLPRPESILCVSAHWYVRATAVTAMTSPRTIHDFSGFPDELFRVQYPAPGSPELARRVADLLHPVDVVLDTDQWGLDHGAWSVLAQMYPDADIPVVQLSIDARLPVSDHIRIGRALAPLTNEGVLVLGSGNVVHNLSRMDWSAGNSGFDWADRFDEKVATAMAKDPASISTLESNDDWRAAVPTPEHFLPLAYVAGIAAELGTPVTRFNYSRTLGSLSMTSYVTEPVR